MPANRGPSPQAAHRHADPAPTARLRAAADKRPLYRKVVESLRQEILDGVYPVGERLPAENDLSLRFQLSRNTIREALRELRESGLVTSRRGSGTTVTRQHSAQYYVHETGSLEDLVQYASLRWDCTVRTVKADQALAEQLDSAPGQRWLRVEGCHSDESGPVYWSCAHIHGKFAGIARLLERRTVPIFQLIEDMYGVRVSQVKQVIRGRPAPADVARQLQLPQGEGVIQVTRTYSLAGGEIVQQSRNLYPLGRFNLEMMLRRSPRK